MFPKAVQVVPMRNCSVYVYFEDGKIVCYDMLPMIEKRIGEADFVNFQNQSFKAIGK